jgi:ParB-like chromosome segregation protein Spo0J
MQNLPIGKIKANPNNPRIIKDDKFAKLVQSLKDLPEMAKVRPVVVNQDMVVLGGNMRLKAMKEAGWKEAPVEIVDWDEDKQRQFIIKDNVGFGEWDWEMLANEWDAEQLDDWGLIIPQWTNGHDINSMDENEVSLEEEFDPIGSASNLHKVIFIFDSELDAGNYFEEHIPDLQYKNTSGQAGKIWQVDKSKTYGKK